MWELGICWEASAISRVPKLEVSSTQALRDSGVSTSLDKRIRRWKVGGTESLRAGDSDSDPIPIHLFARRRRRVEARREQQSRSILFHLTFVRPSPFCLLRRRRQKQTEKRQYRKSIRHSLTLSRFVRQGGKCSTVLEGLNALTDERTRAGAGGGALSSEAFERQARSRTFGHLRARERESEKGGRRAHTCVQYRPAPLHHHQPGIYSRQRGERGVGTLPGGNFGFGPNESRARNRQATFAFPSL